VSTHTVTTTSSTISHTAGSHVLVRNIGGYDAIVTCRGVDYPVTPTDPDGGVTIPARGAAVTARTATGATTLDVTVVELGDSADGGAW
jgi:hypothetical protein